MNKNLLPKTVLIVALLALAVYTLYPPSQTLKPGIDLAGGTSLIYAIDAEGLTAAEQQDLAQRMITVLRRRIDPTNIQNLLWRPQGNTRFEIQMPLASEETQLKRDQYNEAKNALLDQNTNPATIMRALQQPVDERAGLLESFAQGDPNRMEILQELASVFDDRTALQAKRDNASARLGEIEETLSEAGQDIERIQANRRDWVGMQPEPLRQTLQDYLGSEGHLELLVEYVATYNDLMDARNQLAAESGVNDRYEEAKRRLDELNLTQEQLTVVLEMPENSADRLQRIEQLKVAFPDRAELIGEVVVAYDAYRPFRGRLDDPRDLQRMLKGAGILEFRILPTTDGTALATAEIEQYIETLMEKGPKYASDNRYVWCEIEDIAEWHVPTSIMAVFGDKYHVLASNQENEVLLHGPTRSDWKLESSRPSTDEMGRRAIAFQLDVRGGNLFYNVTRNNPSRPLCILLDGIAISAPEINPDKPIRDRGIITGSFTQTQVTDMVNKLNAGSLPARLIEQPISEKIIGPAIGADNRDQGITAGLIGLVIVIVVMLAYYLKSGAIADAALLLNILFVLAIMAGLNATFTLPGIAGIILTIGMSVDANVLIFERIREEQERGAGLATAIKNGYERAFTTVFDANLTTFITAAILYKVASEEIKGFAIVLMLGIASSMFTALFVTRVIFDFLAAKRLIADKLVMLRLIHQPNVDWMAMRKVFFCTSGVLIVAGLVVFFTRDDAKNNKYDIEFSGGTSVQINLKEDVSLTRQDVQDRIQQMGATLGNPALQAANVYSVGKSGRQYEITTTATNKIEATVDLGASGGQTAATVTAAITEALTELGRELPDLSVSPAGKGNSAFVVSTGRVSPSLLENVLQTAFPTASISEPAIDEVVSDAVRTAFEGQLEVQQDLVPTITSEDRITDDIIDTYPELADYIGGLKMECRVDRAASIEDIDRRMKDLQFKPDTQNLTWYSTYGIFAPEMRPVDPNAPLDAFVFVSAPPEAGLRELDDDEWNAFAANERARLLAAAQLETSLPRVTQIDPSVGSEQKTRALIAIVLSLTAIVAYIWIRFGNVRYGLTAIAALVHDVVITLGAVTACTYIAGSALGQALLIGDFKIDLAMIAAFLTLIGYSLNDTIVVFDRIRENRRRAQLTPQAITNSINQTISRTIMTSFTTFIVVLIMYIFGGQGLRGFTFAIGFGVIIGTYSSIAIAAPLLLIGVQTQKSKSK